MTGLWLALVADAVIVTLAILFTPVSVPMLVGLIVLVAVVQVTTYAVTHVSK